MSSRRADVFFYGLFMDADLLRAKGFAPEAEARGVLEEWALRIGRRATLVREAGGVVYGNVMTLTLSEIDSLYSDPSLRVYQPVAVPIRLTSGGVVAALCYVLPVEPSADEWNEEYAAQLREITERLGLPWRAK